MAGGVGSRFWPLSTGNHPKQFIDVLGVGETLLQSTFNRFSKIVPEENILIVTNARYSDLVKEQLPTVSEDQILLEPAKRNTTPCIAYATFKVLQKNKDAIFVISPSDHLITDDAKFQDAIRATAEESSKSNVLCTLGINPHKPSTSYGYIQHNGEEGALGNGVKKVKSFTEKPDLEHAQAFLDSGDFLWNSGIFIWSGAAIYEALEKYTNNTFLLFEEGKDLYYTDAEEMFIKKIYPQCHNESIDYAVMEKAENVYVLPVSFGWNDLGTWGSVYEYNQSEDDENVVVNKNAILTESSGNIISVSKGKMVVVDGLKDYIIAESEGKILIFPKSKEEKIKNVVNDVKVNFGEKFI
jgi:mannose-1-phosphate guanylyltransferase